MQVYILYLIATICIILGFIALLKQKTYLDSRTNQPTSIEIPRIGKMKSNYPALIFVFLGFAIAVLAMIRLNRDVQTSQSPSKVLWTIKGTLKNPAFDSVDWNNFTLELREPDIKYDVPNNGLYEITFLLDSGITPESKYRRLEFTDENGRYINIDPIFLDKELEKFNKNEKSKLRKKEINYREYSYPDLTADQ